MCLLFIAGERRIFCVEEVLKRKSYRKGKVMKRLSGKHIWVWMICALMGIGQLSVCARADELVPAEEIEAVTETGSEDMDEADVQADAAPESAGAAGTENAIMDIIEEDEPGSNAQTDAMEEAPAKPEEDLSGETEPFLVEVEEVDLEETQPLAADGALSGTCGMDGAEVNWLLADGVLTVSGSGAMDDYITLADFVTGEVSSSNVQPWYSYRGRIREVVIENGITVIGYNAFADCYNLKKVTIADTVKKLRHNAFANCTSLDDINMGSGIETLETDIFYGAAAESLTLPKSLKTLSDASLIGMFSLKNIYVEGGNTVYQSDDGVLFSDGGKTLVCYPAGRQGSYTVPSGTTAIAASAFCQSAVSDIKIPDSVAEIGGFAFSYCTNLAAIIFPANVTVIRQGVCFYAKALQSVTLPEGVSEIQADAFYGCASLKSITVPASATAIADDAFDPGTAVTVKNPAICQMEDGTYVDGVRVGLSVRENYKMAFQVLNLVNKERASAGLDKLVMDANLLETAMLRAAETVLYWDHTRPCGISCFSASSLMWGENIALGQTTASSVMNSWMNSPGHRANILGNNYTTIGIGCVYYGGTYYWVQCFGTESAPAASSSSYSDKTVARSIVVKKDSTYYQASFKLSKTSLTSGETAEIIVNWDGLTLNDSGAAAESSNTSVCTVKDGKITAAGAGTATIKCYFPGYPEKAETIKVTVTAGKQIKITYNANGGSVKTKSKKVTQNQTYGTLASPTRKGYAFLGWYTAKSGGKKITASSKVSLTKNTTVYAHWKKVTVKTPAIKKLVNQSEKKLTVKINKSSGAKGYQIVYATNSKFTKDKKSVTVASETKTLSGLKKGKTYYVKVRAYKTDSTGARVYSSYSKVKTVRIKK